MNARTRAVSAGLIAALAASGLFGTACVTRPSVDAASGPSAAASPDPALPAAPSLYELPARLVDQRGEELGLDAYRGQPVLLAMFYATCPTACPLLMGEIKRLEARLPPATLARTRVLLVSLDPATDTPEILMAAVTREGVDGSRWTLCRTDEETVRDLAAILGVRYKAQKDGTIDHSSAIFLLDARGAIVEKLDGLGQPTDAMERRLQQM